MSAKGLELFPALRVPQLDGVISIATAGGQEAPIGAKGDIENPARMSKGSELLPALRVSIYDVPKAKVRIYPKAR